MDMYSYSIYAALSSFFSCSSSLISSLISTGGSTHKLRNEAMKSRKAPERGLSHFITIGRIVMYYVYILESIATGRFYVGSTQNIKNRLRKHNAGHSRATKGYRPWRLVYYEEYSTRGDALRREYDIKRRKSRMFIENLITGDSSA